MTPIGIIFLVIGMGVLLLKPRGLLPLTIIAGSFGAASMTPTVAGGAGLPVSPEHFCAALWLGYLMFKGLTQRRSNLDPRFLGLAIPLILFTIYAVASSYIFPRLWEGEIAVWPQRHLFGVEAIVPLGPSRGNITQTVYLCFLVTLFIYTANYIKKFPESSITIINAVFISGYVICFITIWQLLSKVSGLFYPSDFIYSNQEWAIGEAQEIGRGTMRINGPFTEPSALGATTAALFATLLWLHLRHALPRWALPLMPLVLLCALISTSTTAYATLLILVPWVLFSSGTMLTPAIIMRLLTMLLAIVIALFAIDLWLTFSSSRLAETVRDVFNATINKDASGSYQDRTTKDLDALRNLLESYGFGVGWGSVRPSSLLPSLLANAGLPGVALIVLFSARLVSLARSAANSAWPNLRLVIKCLGILIVAEMVPHFLAGSTVNSAGIWLTMAALGGLALSAQASAATESPSPASPASRDAVRVRAV